MGKGLLVVPRRLERKNSVLCDILQGRMIRSGERDIEEKAVPRLLMR
jgi:hypothetical protein